MRRELVHPALAFAACAAAIWPQTGVATLESAMSRNTLIRTYLLGLFCIFMGAGLTDWSGSWVPLALGASACLMFTASTVKGILKRR